MGRKALSFLSFIPFLSFPGILSGQGAEAKVPYFMTVNGKIPALGTEAALIHEHVITDFSGANDTLKFSYDPEQLLPQILPHFRKLKSRGISLVFECTPAYIGRNVRLLKMISDSSGISIVTNTGYYAAADKKFLPPHAFQEDAGILAARWESEWLHGIGNTGIRPGFIKLGVGKGELDTIEAKLLLAASYLHKRSGLPIAMHSGDGAAAISGYELLRAEGVDASRFIWVHAQNGEGREREEMARKGVWISLDGVNSQGLDSYTEMVMHLRNAGLLSRVLLSHDDGWALQMTEGKLQLQPYANGNTKPYTSLQEELLGLLQKAGLSEEEKTMLLIQNPREALSLGNEK